MRTVFCVGCLCVCPPVAADPRVDFAHGLLAESRGEGPQAEDFFKRALDADPLALPLVRRAVSSRMAAGDRAGATKLWRNLAAARPDDLTVQIGYADFLERHGGGDDLAHKLAIGTLEKSLGKSPGHPQLIERLFRLHRANGNPERANGLLETLSLDDPESALLHASLSKQATAASDFQARRQLDQRLLESFERNPDDPALARSASEQLRNNGNLDTAIRILERHADAEPASLALRGRLGILYFAAKRDSEGEKVLKELLTISPRQAVIHQALAKHYRLIGNPDLARSHSAELLAIRGGSASEFAALADEFLTANNPRAARLLLEKAVFDHPAHAELKMKLAIASRRDPETAVAAGRLFREAENAMADGVEMSPDFLLESAEMLILERQIPAAEDRLRLAIRSFPAEEKVKAAAAMRRLAALWDSENRNAEAARSLRQRADSLDATP